MNTRVCIVSASGQNVFFGEILEAFGVALRDHGVSVEESVDCFPLPADDLVYLYVPHEYHPLVDDFAHPTQEQLRRAVALSTEQPGTPWFEIACGIAQNAGAVVDINVLGTRELERNGIHAEHAPLGYVPTWDAWGGIDYEPRSIDVAFLGGHTERRARAIARCAPVLSRRRGAIHLVESHRPHAQGDPCFLAYERKWRMLADAKILLNVHRAPLAYMEWHRIIGAAINGCAIVSEHAAGAEPFIAGEHFVSSDYDALPGVLEGLLCDPQRIESLRDAAYELVRERMPMSVAVAALLAAVERAGRVPPRKTRVRPPEPVPMPRSLPPARPGWQGHAEEMGDQLPVRMALKHLVMRMQHLDRRVQELAIPLNGNGNGHHGNGSRNGNDASPPAPRFEDVVEHFGPELEQPRVSVLLTVHNYGDYVGAALRSVALADMRDVEVIAVDDASTDDSVDAIHAVCEELSWLSVRLVRRARNGGLPVARNVALTHARAELLFVLDADNLVLPQGLDRLADALDHDPDAAFAYGIVEAFDASGPSHLINWLDWDPDRLRHGNYVDAMAMIRRSALEAIGGYPLDPALYGWEDFAVWAAMAHSGRYGVRVPDFAARYRVSAHSMISLTDIDTSAVWAALLRKYPTLARSA